MIANGIEVGGRRGGGEVSFGSKEYIDCLKIDLDETKIITVQNNKFTKN